MEKIRASILLNGLAPEGFDAGDAEVSLVTTDSREVCPGCIFVAFPGERFDGHDFAAKALEAGAFCVVLNHPVEGVPAEKAVLCADLPVHRVFGELNMVLFAEHVDHVEADVVPCSGVFPARIAQTDHNEHICLRFPKQPMRERRRGRSR